MRRGLIRRDENWARDWRSISRRQTGYSQPIPKAGIGGSPRFAAHARIWHFREARVCGVSRPSSPKTVKRLPHNLDEGDHILGLLTLQVSVGIVIEATLGEPLRQCSQILAH